LGLLLVVQLATFLAVDIANSRNAQAEVHDALVVAARVFDQLIDNRSQRLIEAARLLSGDFAFKEAFASQDIGTIRSALRNHKSRIKADAFMLFDLDGGLIVSTDAESKLDTQLDLIDLIELADDSDSGEAASIASLAGVPHQWVVVPLLAPVPVAWLIIGFNLDDRLVDSLRDLTLADVSILGVEDGDYTIHASTLSVVKRTGLPRTLSASGFRLDESFLLRSESDDFVTLITPLDKDMAEVGQGYVAVLQRSLDVALEPYHRLRLMLLILTITALLISLLIAKSIVGSIANPILHLATAAHRIRQGDYLGRVATHHTDEIGELFTAFNEMTKGLAERDTDALTRLFTRRYFDMQMRIEFDRANQYQQNFALIMSDVDHFKSFNDTHGHQIGDFVLKELGQILQSLSRNSDIACRYGGEEFALICRETDLNGAIIIAERIRKTIDSRSFSSTQGELKVTVSLGVASFVENRVNSIEEMIKMADDALYECKKRGRNQVQAYNQ
jgi:diguanylate cyclase (GGDEF)-like protein